LFQSEKSILTNLIGNFRRNPALEPIMRPVAKRLVGAGLAAAEKGAAIFLGGPFLRLEGRALVRAIAKGLALRAAAAAPELGFSLGHFDRKGGFLRDDRRVV